MWQYGYISNEKGKKMNENLYRFIIELMDEEQKDQLQAYLIMEGTLKYNVKSNNWEIR